MHFSIGQTGGEGRRWRLGLLADEDSFDVLILISHGMGQRCSRL